MVNLIAKTPADGALPVTIGALTLTEHCPQAITGVMPLDGAADAVSRDIGCAFPAPGRVSVAEGVMAVWAGRNLALVLGPPVASPDAAITDQSDGWAVFDLTGPGGDAALARLSPVDTRAARFGPGATARTLLGHMNASVTRVDDDTLRIMVFRSMAATAIHDLTRAMDHAQRRG